MSWSHCRTLRSFLECSVNTPIEPHTTLRQLTLHPNDQIPTEKKMDLIYKIPFLSSNKTHIGETGRTFGTWKNEHRKECEKQTARHTQATKEKAEQQKLKAAISDHCKRGNHVTDWEEARIIQSENNITAGSGKPLNSGKLEGEGRS